MHSVKWINQGLDKGVIVTPMDYTALGAAIGWIFILTVALLLMKAGYGK